MIKKLLPFITFVCLLLATPVSAQHSVAREWNELLLEAIRGDFARPTVHARNLFHSSVAMYDAWAVYDDEAETFFLGKTVDGFECPFVVPPMPSDLEAAREEAISYAAYRLLRHRFLNSPGAFLTLNRLDTHFEDLGYDEDFTSIDYSAGSPAALGNYIAEQLIAFGLQDGSNEAFDYENQFYEPVNEPLIVEFAGNPDLTNFNRWQPLTLSVFIDQAGNVIPGATPPFLSPEWGNVTPFALNNDDLTIYERDGDSYYVYHDPGPPALMDTLSGGAMSEEYQWNFSLVSVWSAHLSPDDEVMWDISPASIGNIALEDYPTTIEGLRDFYNLVDGGDIGTGRDLNPFTGAPYEPQIVPRGDYARVLAEFWADGPDSETPPGHWFTILNTVNDDPDLVRRFGGQGELLEPLEWDVKTYLTLGGAVHDAAVTVWGIKGWYDYLRPVSAIRGMARFGQSTDPELPNYHVGGLPLIDGFIALVEEGDPLAGSMNQHVGKIKVKAWRGPDFISIPEIQDAGVDWILAENWWPYQRPTFVSPNFAGYISGHSTFSRAAAEVMTAITGDPYFPGGVGEFVAEADEFLVFEDGPSVDITLEWATYRDASDQCSLSRIWGGIHPPVDDVPGRLIGIDLGMAAFDLARDLFYKDEDNDGFYSYEDCDDTNENVYPGAPEICDGLDNDCNDDIDEGVLLTFYLDADEDGFGDAAQTSEACTVPMGYVADATDCDDADADEFPGQTWYLDTDGDNYGDGTVVSSCERPEFGRLATELIELTTDCDNMDADEFPGQIWYLDTDGDNYGAGVMLTACERPEFGRLATELIELDTDCDDADGNEFPGQVWFLDLDNDNYGDGTTAIACERPAFAYLPAELTATDTDCDDNDADEFPGQVWYLDLDEDEYGDGTTVTACERPAFGNLTTELIELDTDCDDEDPQAFPTQSWYIDADADGHGSGEVILNSCERPSAQAYLQSELIATEGDCDDNINTVYPGAPEICDELDNDCNDEVDEDLPLNTYFRDADADGFGDAEQILEICGDLPLGFSLNADDCNDADADVYPGAPEVADNGVDEDCNEVDLFEEFKVFPNPFTNEVTVHLARQGKIEVRIFDAAGRLVYQGNEQVIDNRCYLSLANLRQGVFFLRLETTDGEELMTERIMKIF